ncbi:TrmB family transcriptional regulator [Halomarina litorea]|uniref:TrmB family transcriptional regulator n=1 Tax=Halomarina litorea TaxID=2961595 RepID=UPI0020C38250|nr:helix-turn-helix domain-containing protein [Halomarina sp. BCD28]
MTNEQDSVNEAVEQLKQLGLKEYEAKCFVALSRVDSATAKTVSEQSEVPRTRVYDATRVLEAKGLIEVQHSTPQQFRAVPIEEAIETLRSRFESQFDALRANIRGLDRPDDPDDDAIHEVWSISGTDAIANRTERLIRGAETEVVLVVGVPSLVTDDLLETLDEATDRGVSVSVGTLDETLRETAERSLDGIETFVSGLEWLRGNGGTTEETAIGRLLLVDGSTILVSSFEPSTGEERAVFGRGFTNGLVLITRRLMSTRQWNAGGPAGSS